jgi:hypothetical protein
MLMANHTVRQRHHTCFRYRHDVKPHRFGIVCIGTLRRWLRAAGVLIALDSGRGRATRPPSQPAGASISRLDTDVTKSMRGDISVILKPHRIAVVGSHHTKERTRCARSHISLLLPVH